MPLLIQLYEKNPVALVLLVLALVVGATAGMMVVLKLSRMIVKAVVVLATGAIIVVIILTLMGRHEVSQPGEPQHSPDVEVPSEPTVTTHPPPDD